MPYERAAARERTVVLNHRRCYNKKDTEDSKRLNIESAVGIKRWGKSLKNELKLYQSICWSPKNYNYLTKAHDFRALLYFSEPYQNAREWNLKNLPDCFVISDANWNKKWNDIAVGDMLYKDENIDIRVLTVNSLSPLKLAFNESSLPVNIYNRESVPTGQVKKMAVKVSYKLEKEVSRQTMIYLVHAEKTAFAMDFLLPNHITTPYIFMGCDCEGMGSTGIRGAFILRILDMLNTDYIATFLDENEDGENDSALIVYPELKEMPISKRTKLAYVCGDLVDGFDIDGTASTDDEDRSGRLL